MKQGKFILSIAAAAAMAAGFAGSAQAQRNPAYQQARSQGLIGEKPDGYLGIVGSGTPELQKIVNDINIQRRAAYTKAAAAQGATVEDFAFTSACNLIANESAGEKYMTPGGQWKTRGSGAPERDSRCP
ncbi:MAG: YdbL family protein [Sphingomonas sp.]